MSTEITPIVFDDDLILTNPMIEYINGLIRNDQSVRLLRKNVISATIERPAAMQATEQAFPQSDSCYHGMDIRTYLAGQALTGYIAMCSGEREEDPRPDIVADMCVMYADAVIERLNRKLSTGDSP